MTEIDIKTYKKSKLPTNPKPNSVYYILPTPSSKVIVYITDQNGVPKIIESEGAINLSGLIPYTGATANTDLGEFQLKAGQIELDQTPTGTFGVGKVRWNDTDGTIEIMLKGGSVTLQLGQEQVLRVVNKTGSNLLESEYHCVYISGAQGNRLKVDLALSNNTLNSNKTIGLVTENIDNNLEGFVTTNGLVRNINTTGSLQSETWEDGDVLYLSAVSAGSLTNVAPTTPNHKVVIGYVVRAHITQGSIFVKVDTGLAITELHDVNVTGLTINKVLGSTTEGIWENKTIAQILGYTPENVSNKDNGTLSTSTTTYPTSGAVKSTVDLKADLVVGKNKFNLLTATVGYFLNQSNVITVNATYDYSDYIAVVPGTTYKSTFNMRAICHYNSSKNFVVGGASADTTNFTCPAGVYFIRISIYHTNLNSFQLEIGTVSTIYENYGYFVNPIQLFGYLKSEDVQDSLASTDTTKPLSANQGLTLLKKINNKANLEAGKNKFDYINNIITNDKFFSSTGAISSASTTYGITDYIDIKPNKAYFSSAISYNGGTYYCFYDINKTFISSSNVTGTLSPSNAVFARFSVLKSAAISTIQIEEGLAASTYESFKLFVAASELNLTDYIKTSELENTLNGKVPILITGKNLFNKDSGLVQVGKFVSYTSGNYSNNATYSVTGKIPIPDGVTQITLSYKHQIAFYNSAGVYISGSNSTDTNKTQSVPVNAIYVDCSVLSAGGIDTFILVTGAELPSTYYPYKKVVSESNLEIYSSQIINDGDPLSADTFKAFLPKEVCVAVGRTIELYNNQVSWCGNISDYHFLWSGVGKSMKRKWTLTGVTIGTNTLTLKVYNKNNILIATKTATVKVVSATVSAPFSVCSIGDSLTNTKAWQPELISLSGGSISLKGTRGSIISGAQRTHEGRSGATSAYYLGNNSYTFDSNGTVGNDGRTQDLNPFWNPATSDVDFAYYKSNYNQNPDKLLIWLGTNGITVDPASNATSIKTFIDKIRLTGGSLIPIFVIHTLFRGNQDGIGVQTGSDGYVANSTYKLEEDLKVFNLQEKILADLSAYSNLYLVPVSTCHDSEFNFGAVSTPVNPRASQVEYLPSEATHPQNQGYLQIADIIFSSLAANQ